MKNLILIFSLIFSFSDIKSQIQTDIPWPTLADSPWPMIKHDPQLTGRSPYKGPQTPTVIWTVDMPNGIFSGPVIGADNNLYFGSYYQDIGSLGYSDYFYCYDRKGNYIWDYKTGTSRPPQSGMLIDSSGTIYFGSVDKYFYALNPDGSLKWKYETTAPIVELAFPNIDKAGNIYISNNRGDLYSFTSDGQVNWFTRYDSTSVLGSKSPAIAPDGNTIYIPGRDSNLFALNLDGSFKWKFSCGNIVKAPLVDSQGNLYLTPEENPQYVYSLFPNGQIRWKYFNQDIGPAGSYSVPTIDYNGNIYVMVVDSNFIGYYPLSLLSLNYNGEFRWRYLFDEFEDFWQPLICDNQGTIYLGETNGYDYYAISSEGELKWKLQLEFAEQQVDNTSAIAEDGTLYIGVHEVSLFWPSEKTLIAIKDTGTVGVHNNEVQIYNYELKQNYPNPFNPSTIIEFSTSEVSHVLIKVYDILGREVTELVNGVKDPGKHQVLFDAKNLSNGVYIYSITAKNNETILFRQSKQMIFIK